MANEVNKIKFGLTNVYYAVAEIAADGTADYDTPVRWPGAASIDLGPEGDNVVFYADNIAYWTGNGNNGYSGDLEIARVIDSFRTDILGDVVDGKGVLFEDTEAPVVHFALLFEFSGDVKHTRHVFYNCTVTRPSSAGQTKGESIEPSTETVTITAKSIYNDTLDKWVPKASTNEDTDSTTYEGWFSAVYQGTAPKP